MRRPVRRNECWSRAAGLSKEVIVGEPSSLTRTRDCLALSYRRAWLLVESVNRSFSEPSTRANVGGIGGEGVELTDFGTEYAVIAAPVSVLNPLCGRSLRSSRAYAVIKASSVMIGVD